MKQISAVLILVGLFLSGCAGTKGVPDYARVDPIEGVTIEHPDQVEDENAGDVIITFTGVLPPRFLVEVDKGVRGVWPIIGTSLINDNPIVSGFCYSMPKLAFGNNPWAIVPMQCGVIGKTGSKDMFIDDKYAFALVNKDGGVWIASPIGRVSNKHTIVDDKTYNWQKFEDDIEYRQELMREIGKTIPEINIVWKERIERFSATVTMDEVQEIAIISGNAQWESFRKKMLNEMGDGKTEDGVRMPSGEIKATYLSEDEIKMLVAKNPHITPWQRFLAKLRIPIVPDIGAATFGVVTSMVDGTIAAFFDDRWDACVARGMCQRRDLSEQVAFLYQLYQTEHVKRMRGE